MSMVLNFCSV
jgi:hypothetical protein